MKSNLIEISLSDLRNFIITMDEKYATQLSNLSLVSLKLRLQFTIAQQQFKDFSSFNTHILNNEDFRNTFIAKLNAHSNELFRDAECWESFAKELKLITDTKTIDVCLFESGNYSDTITLLICIAIFKLTDKCTITIIDLLNRNSLNTPCVFDNKEMELGVLNFSGLKFNESLDTYFTKTIKGYLFEITNTVSVINYKDYLNASTEHNALVARNLTLNKNFTSHENLFQLYLKSLKNNGILFTGNKEGFKWCNKFETLTYQKKSAPIYHKK